METTKWDRKKEIYFEINNFREFLCEYHRNRVGIIPVITVFLPKWLITIDSCNQPCMG